MRKKSVFLTEFYEDAWFSGKMYYEIRQVWNMKLWNLFTRNVIVDFRNNLINNYFENCNEMTNW